MQYRCVLMISYGLVVIWTGLLRSVEAQAFKPNAFWFCMVTGLIAIVAGNMYRLEWKMPATIVGLLSAGPVLCFYLNCFITQPEKDANYRIAIAIVASIAAITVIMLPSPGCCKPKTEDSKS